MGQSAVKSQNAAFVHPAAQPGRIYVVETDMQVIAIFATLSAAAAAQTPGVRTIMECVGRNQAKAVEQRKEFTFHQEQLLRLNRGSGKVAREENREYEVAPNGHGVRKELLHFAGRYEYKGKYITYDRELSPLWSETFGGKLSYRFTDHFEGELKVDVFYYSYADFAPLLSRTGTNTGFGVALTY